MDMHLKVKAEPGAVWFIIGVLGVFSGMALLSFFMRMSYAGPDEIFMLVIGVVGVGLIWRTLRYYRVPNLSILGDSLIWRPFWKPRVRIAYADVDHFIGAWDVVRPRVFIPGKPAGIETGETLPIGVLIVVLTSGKRVKIVLPTNVPSKVDDVFTRLTQVSGRRLIEG